MKNLTMKKLISFNWFYPFNMKGLKFLFVLFFFISFLNVHSQIISQEEAVYNTLLPGSTLSACPGGSCLISLPPARFNQDYQVTIPLTAPITTHVFSISNVNGSCTEITSNHTLTNTVNIIDFIVTERCAAGTSNSLSFTLNVDDGVNPVEQQNFIIPIIRDSVKLVLALDISGSMILPVTGGTGTRLDALKDAVYALVFKLEELKQGLGDSLSLTYFSSTVIDPSIPISEGFIVIDNNPMQWSWNEVFTDLDPRTPMQMTAMGEGLLHAKNKLKLDDSDNLKRLVFLFTDGLQNWGNQVNADGMSFSGSLDSLNNYSTNPKDSIQYFPVATWGAGAEPVILQEIANQSNGEVLYVTPASTPYFTDWFDNQLVNMLDQGSPQIVLNKSMSNLSGELSIPFSMNEHINTLLIQLNTNDKVKLSIIKDGVNLNSKARVNSGDNFTILSYHFPIIDDPAINSGGEWKIILKGETQNPLSLSVIVDDHYLDYECTSNKSLYTVGDAIQLKTTLTHIGDAIVGSGNTVTAIVLKPGDDLGDLLSTYDTPELDDSLVDVDSGASQKFNELMMNDTSFYNALLPNEQIVNLTDEGNGVFSGSFSATELAGFYNIIYLMDGEIINFGKFKRRKTKSVVFVFGQVEEEEPEVAENAPPSSSGSNKGLTVLKIRPRNKYDKYMGPGFKSKIKLQINPKYTKTRKVAVAQKTTIEKTPIISEIKDNLDGSYYLYIANLDTDKWNFSIIVNDEVLHNYSKSFPWWVYLILIILILLVYLFKKSGGIKKFNWILLIIWLIIIILHYTGYLNFLFI
ncbi:MAG: VWA domain-containing protein [Bacteroidales bacterium]|nr:VWA domain-containing protein [Bacteroidales bacterium]